MSKRLNHSSLSGSNSQEIQERWEAPEGRRYNRRLQKAKFAALVEGENHWKHVPDGKRSKRRLVKLREIDKELENKLKSIKAIIIDTDCIKRKYNSNLYFHDAIEYFIFSCNQVNDKIKDLMLPTKHILGYKHIILMYKLIIKVS